MIMSYEHALRSHKIKVNSGKVEDVIFLKYVYCTGKTTARIMVIKLR